MAAAMLTLPAQLEHIKSADACDESLGAKTLDANVLTVGSLNTDVVEWSSRRSLSSADSTEVEDSDDELFLDYNILNQDQTAEPIASNKTVRAKTESDSDEEAFLRSVRRWASSDAQSVGNTLHPACYDASLVGGLSWPEDDDDDDDDDEDDVAVSLATKMALRQFAASRDESRTLAQAQGLKTATPYIADECEDSDEDGWDLSEAARAGLRRFASTATKATKA